MKTDVSKIDILDYLSRNDKWYLSGGELLLWAPTHPQWLDQLGFWDGAHYFDSVFQPVFTITLLDNKERVLTPKFVSREWNPAFLAQRYTVPGKIELIEKKALLPGDTLISELTFKNNANIPCIIHAVMWTGQSVSLSEAGCSLSDIACDNRTLSFRRSLGEKMPDDVEVTCSLGMNRKMMSVSITGSQGIPNLPRWEYTPFYETFQNGRLHNENWPGPVRDGELIYMALHTPLKLNPHARKSLVCAANISGKKEASFSGLAVTLKASDPVKQSIQNWRDFFERVPHFECSEKHVQKYYWYRWYSMKLCTLSGEQGTPPSPSVTEGPAECHAPSAHCAPVLMREARWMDTPDVAHGCFRTFLKNLTPLGDDADNDFRPDTDFHWANVGDSILAVDMIHPDKKLLRIAYDALVKYARYCDRERDGEGSGLYDLHDPFRTGRGYAGETEAAAAGGGRAGGDDRPGVKGVDASVFMYCTKRALSVLADRLGRAEDAQTWDNEAETIKRAVVDLMWDPKDEMFYDVDAGTMERVRVKGATCFYPYMTDMVGEGHVQGLKHHLLDPEVFWTLYPVATLSRDEAAFSPETQWMGKRSVRPWKGRVWPIVNCHMIEALVCTGNVFDGSLRSKAVELMTRFIHMMFLKDDVRFPTSYEHYDPVSGKPSLYRGLNDVQHSWMVDLILKYVAGVQPQEDGKLVIDPLPFEMTWVRVDRIPYRGHVLRVEIEGEDVSLYVDGVLKIAGKRGVKLEVDLKKK